MGQTILLTIDSRNGEHKNIIRKIVGDLNRFRRQMLEFAINKPDAADS